MNNTMEKIRRTCLIFFSSVTVLFCVYCNVVYPPSPFLYRSFYLGMAFILYFLTRLPKGKGRPWDNILFSLGTLGGVAVCLYMIVQENRITEDYYRASENDLYVFLVYIVSAMIVISRMGGGKIVAGMGFIASCYVFWGHYIPGLFGHAPFSIEQSTTMVLTDLDNGALGSLVGLLARLLSIFLIFAALLLATGLGDFINAIASSLLGRLRGGPAKIAVVSSALFGTISGSPVANVAATGSFTIPLMKKIGYSPVTAGAIESCSSSGGELVPPIMGPCAFIMSEILGISYGIICLWGIVPAFLWYWSIYWAVHYSAWKEDIKTWAPPKEETMRAIKGTFHVAFALVIFVILLRITRIPEMSVFWSTVALFFISLIRRTTRMNRHRLELFLEKFAESFSGIGLLLSIIGVFVSALISTGFHVKVGMILFGGMHHWLTVIVFTFLLCIVFGMAMPVVAAYVSVVFIVAPVLQSMGFSLAITHMFVFYACCLAPLTPPVAMAAYTAASISGAGAMETAVKSVTMGLSLWVIPFLLFRYSIYFGMGRPILEIVLFTAVAALGCYAFVLGSIGYFKGHLKKSMRAALVCSSLLVLQPLSMVVSEIGLACSIILIAFLWIKFRQQKNASVAESV